MMVRGVLVALATVFLATVASAQLSAGGRPLSFTAALSTSAVPQHSLPTVDIDALLAEDALATKDEPFRFAAPIPVRVSTEDPASGVWTRLADGGRVWRAVIASPGALSLNFVFDRFHLPEGNRLFISSLDGSRVLGAFTSANNKPHGKFATAPIAADKVVIELDVAPGAKPGVVSLAHANHAYRSFESSGLFNFGNSGRCNWNSVCDVADDWQDQVRGVSMILTAGGSRLCSGSLINNARNDSRPLYLTANHCLGGNDLWVFMFNYRSPICELENQQDGPTSDTLQGSTLLASRAASDFALLEISEPIPASYNLHFNGWNAIDEPSEGVVGIHHPSGDVQKWSYSEGEVISDEWSAVERDTHWRVDHWDIGTTEPGSSGSPLFDSDHRIIGQLHGGSARCSGDVSIGYDVYGKVARSMTDGTDATSRLIDHLDPDNTGILVLDGMDA